MITNTINRVLERKKYPNHPYIKAFWGYYKKGNWKKRLIYKILK